MGMTANRAALRARRRWFGGRLLGVLAVTVAAQVAPPVAPPAAVAAQERRAAELAAARAEVAAITAQRGEGDIATATSLCRLAEVLQAQASYAEAERVAERALAIREKQLGAAAPAVAQCVSIVARQLEEQGEYAAARPLYDRALAIHEKALGGEHADTAQSLCNLARLLVAQAHFDEAQRLDERALAIRQKLLGPGHPDTAQSLNNLAVRLGAQRRWDEARPLCERALAIWESVRGPDHPDTARGLCNLAALLHSQGQLEAALPLYRRSLEIRETALGPDHPETAQSLENLAALLDHQGQRDMAAPLFERALAIREKALGPDHPCTARSLNHLAVLLVEQRKFAPARDRFERALSIRERALGPEHPDTAATLDDFARLAEAEGRFDEARARCEQALAIRERSLGTRHPDTARSLHHLAALLDAQGHFAEARPLCERALAIDEEAFGADAPEIAADLDRLAALLRSEGDRDGSVQLGRRALRIREMVLGADDPGTATSVCGLASALAEGGDLAAALPLFERALAIDERAFGSDHPRTAADLNNLAVIRHSQGKYDEAVALYRRALAIDEKVFGRDHPESATDLHNLALSLEAQGKHDEASPLAADAFAIREALLGPAHPDTVATFIELISGHDRSVLLAARRTESALADGRRATEFVQRAVASRSSWFAAESDILQGHAQLVCCLDALLGLAPELSKLPDSAARTAIYDAVGALKGAVLRTLVARRARRLSALDPAAQAMVAELRDVQAALAAELYRFEVADHAAHDELLGKLREQRTRLERELARPLAAIGGRSATFADLARLLPPRTALVDFLVHRVRSPLRIDARGHVEEAAWSEPQLTAWITTPGAPAPVWIEFGGAAPIAEAVRGYLDALRMRGPQRVRGVAFAESRGEQAKEAARLAAAGSRLRDRLWRPLAANFAQVKRLFVVADGFLATLPFEVIPLADGRHLIEQLALSYATDPTALAALLESPPHPVDPRRGTLLIAADIDYDHRGADAEAAVASADGRPRSRGGFGLHCEPLPSTREEAASLAALRAPPAPPAPPAPDAAVTMLSGTAATEERLKAELVGKRWVHLATHGFFLPEGVPTLWDRARSQVAAKYGYSTVGEARRVSGLLPGLLTGLACAGANLEMRDARDDGRLTAEELTWLDLSACELAVLSACDTGIGRERGGEGMASLRTAFESAGAKSVIASLWEVDDAATVELMRGFYERLWRRGKPKGDALRDAQLELIRRERAAHAGDTHPETWGAFTLSGDWR